VPDPSRLSSGPGDARRWTWPADLTDHRFALREMLTASAADEGILGYGDEVTAADGEAFADGLQRGLRDGSTHVLLGQDAVNTFAMCVIHRSEMANCRHLADVSKAYLDPRVRRTGAVVELVAAVAEKLTDLGVERIQIDVREDSPAHRVWSAFGFVSFGVLDDYSRYGGVSHRGHYMTITVPDLTRSARARLDRTFATHTEG
jgi:GNAT superfamily N-acetyltransferase